MQDSLAVLAEIEVMVAGEDDIGARSEDAGDVVIVVVVTGDDARNG